MTESPSSGRSTFRTTIIMVVVVATLSILILIASAGSNRRSEGLATSPFGWNRLIVIHAACVLPLSWCVARAITERQSTTGGRGTIVAWGMAGILVALVSLVAGTVPGRLLNSPESHTVSRFIVRLIWPLALQVPWLVLGQYLVRDSRQPAYFSLRNLAWFAVMTAVGVPLSFQIVFTEQQTTLAKNAWQQGKIADARQAAQRLVDLGSRVSFGERPSGVQANRTVQVTPYQALDDLSRAFAYVEREIERLENQHLAEAERIQLADLQLALNRPRDAEATLSSTAPITAQVAVKLAQLCQLEGRVDEGRQWAKEALRLVSKVESGAAEGSDRVQLAAYDLLVVWSGEESKFDDAEQYLHEALSRLPQQQAAIHHRLGNHYEFIGDLARAREHQLLATQLAPEQFSPPDPIWLKVLSTGAPVGLARPKSSRYR